MKIAIVSDSHDNITNIKKFVSVAKKEKFNAIIHCGDMGGPTSFKLFSKLNVLLYYTFGNVDAAIAFELFAKVVPNYKNLKIFKPFGELELDGKKIAFVHYLDFAYGLACTKKYDAVFYGHNHLKKSEKVGNCLLVNPGSLSGYKYKNPEVKASYAIYDTKKDTVEIKKL